MNTHRSLCINWFQDKLIWIGWIILSETVFTPQPRKVTSTQSGSLPCSSVVDDQLVIEEKGMHSVEKFLIARRLMYWQVYLHKTSSGRRVALGAEF